MLTQLSLAVALSACAPHPESADVADKAETRIPMPQKDGSYAMQVVELTGLNNLFELSGKFARFFLSPRIADGHLDGLAPRGHFVKSGSLYVPSDSLSLQLVTVYAHMQKFAALDEELGAGGVNKWPRDIGIGVRISGGLTNNAFYDGETDSMLFVPFVSKDLPIPVNAGILAHEHFHSLFYKLVMVPLQQTGQMSSHLQGSVHSQDKFYDILGISKKSQSGDVLTAENQEQMIYHLLLTRGLNEGLADFWGWMYTNDTRFIEKSLQSEGARRDLQVKQENRALSLRLSTRGQLRGLVAMWPLDPKFLMARINNEAYTIGTVYSRILKAYVDAHTADRGISEEAARKDVARVILKTLPGYRDSLLALKENEFYDPAQFILSFAAQAGPLKEKECAAVMEILNLNAREGAAKYACDQDATDANFRQLMKKPAPVLEAKTVAEPPPAAPEKSEAVEPKSSVEFR